MPLYARKSQLSECGARVDLAICIPL